MMRSTPSRRSESIRRKLRKRRSSVERTRWTKRRTNSTTTRISCGLSYSGAGAQANRLRPGLTILHGFFHQSSHIKQFRLAESRPNKLKARERNALVTNRNWHCQGWIARETYRDRILNVKD